MSKHSITISKATLSAGLFLKVSYEEHLPGNSTRNYPGMTSTDPVHEDLTRAFNLLPPHMALICEEITNEDFIKALPEDSDTKQEYIVEMGESVPAIAAKKTRNKKPGIIPNINAVADDEELEAAKFQCDFISIKGHGGSIDTITLSGTKLLSTGKHKDVGTPQVKLIYDEYKYAEDLSLIVETIKFEIHEFLFNGKKAPDAPDLFSDGIGLDEHTLKTNAYRDPTESISDNEPEYESEVIAEDNSHFSEDNLPTDTDEVASQASFNDEVIPDGEPYVPGGDLDIPADEDSY